MKVDRRFLDAMAAMGFDTPEGVLGEAPREGLKLLHVWADDAGESHSEELTIPLDAAALPPMKGRVRPEVPIDSTRARTPHCAPGHVFMINLTGDLDCETSDGAKAYVPVGGIAYLEDTTGKGHVTTPLSPVTLLALRAPDDFDIRAWCAKG